MSTEVSSPGAPSPGDTPDGAPAQETPAQETPAQETPAQETPAQQAPAFDPDGPWKLSPDVALRPESFGALAYHFGNRKLSFLKTPRLVEVVQQLVEHPTARDAVGTLPEAERESYLKALASLSRTEMIVPA